MSRFYSHVLPVLQLLKAEAVECRDQLKAAFRSPDSTFVSALAFFAGNFAYGLFTFMTFLLAGYVPIARMILDVAFLQFLDYTWWKQVLYEKRYSGLKVYSFATGVFEIVFWDRLATVLRALGTPVFLLRNLLHFNAAHLFGNAVHNGFYGTFDMMHYWHCTLNTTVLYAVFGIDAIGSSMILAAGFVDTFLRGDFDMPFSQIAEMAARMFYPFVFNPVSPMLHLLGGFTAFMLHYAGHFGRVRALPFYENLRVIVVLEAFFTRRVELVLLWLFAKFGVVAALPVEKSATSMPSMSPTALAIEHGHVIIDVPSHLDLPMHLHWVVLACLFTVIFIGTVRRKKVKVSAPGCNFVSTSKVHRVEEPFLAKGAEETPGKAFSKHPLDVHDSKYYSVRYMGAGIAYLVPCQRTTPVKYSRAFLSKLEQDRRVCIAVHTDGALKVWLSLRGQDDSLADVFKEAYTPFARSASAPGVTRRVVVAEVVAKFHNLTTTAGSPSGGAAGSMAEGGPLSTVLHKVVDVWLSTEVELAAEYPSLFSYTETGLLSSLASKVPHLGTVSGVYDRLTDVLPIIKASIVSQLFVNAVDYQLRTRCPKAIYDSFFSDVFRNSDSVDNFLQNLTRLPKVFEYVAFGKGSIDNLGIDDITRLTIRNDTLLNKYAILGPNIDILLEFQQSESEIETVLLGVLAPPLRMSLLARLANTKALHNDANGRLKVPQSVNIQVTADSGRLGKTDYANDLSIAVAAAILELTEEQASKLEPGKFMPGLKYQTNVYPGSKIVIGHDLFTATDPKAKLETAMTLHSLTGGEPCELPQAEISKKGRIVSPVVVCVTSNKVGMQLTTDVISNPVQFQQRFQIQVEVHPKGKRGPNGHSIAVVPKPGEMTECEYDVCMFSPTLNAQGGVDDPINVYTAAGMDTPAGKWTRAGLTRSESIRCVRELALLIRGFNERVKSMNFHCKSCKMICCECEDMQSRPFTAPVYLPTPKKEDAPRQDNGIKPLPRGQLFVTTGAVESVISDERLLNVALVSASRAVGHIPNLGWYIFLGIACFTAPWQLCVLLALLTYLLTLTIGMASETMYKLQKYKVIRRVMQWFGMIGEKGYATSLELAYKMRTLSLSEDTKYYLLLGSGAVAAVVAYYAHIKYDAKRSSPVVEGSDTSDLRPTGQVQPAGINPVIESVPNRKPEESLAVVKRYYRVPGRTDLQVLAVTGVRVDSNTVLCPAHLLRADHYETVKVLVDGHAVVKQTMTFLSGRYDLMTMRTSHAKVGCLPLDCWRSEVMPGQYRAYSLQTESGYLVANPASDVLLERAPTQLKSIGEGVMIYSCRTPWAFGCSGGVLCRPDGAPVGIGLVAGLSDAYVAPQTDDLTLIDEAKALDYSQLAMRTVLFVSVKHMSDFAHFLTHGFTPEDYRVTAGRVVEVEPVPSGFAADKGSLEYWSNDISGLGCTVGVLAQKLGQKPGCERREYEYTAEALALVGASVGDYTIINGGSVPRLVNGVLRKVAPLEDYVTHTMQNQQAYDAAAKFDPGFEPEELTDFLTLTLSKCPHQFTKRPVSLEEAVRGNQYVSGMDMSTAAGIGLGKKREHMSKSTGQVSMPEWLVVASNDVYASMLSGTAGPVIFTIATKRDEIRRTDKLKVRTINASAELARQVAQRRLLLPIMEWLVRNGRCDALGFMPGCNMHDPAFVRELFVKFEEESASDDLARMESFHSAELKEASREFLLIVADLLGYTSQERRAVENELKSIDYAGVMVQKQLLALSARNSSGHCLTTWLNCIRVWLGIAMWCLASGNGFREVVKIIFGDDMVRRHDDPAHYVEMADYFARLGFVVTSAFDKTKKSDPGGLDKFEFLKRTLVVREGIYYAPLDKLSVVKSLAYPRHKKEGASYVINKSDMTNTVRMAMREAYIGSYADVMEFCLRLDAAMGLGLRDLPSTLHDSYVARQFTFDYVVG